MLAVFSGLIFVFSGISLCSSGSQQLKLENDDNCGEPTGGKAECYFDCSIHSSSEGSGQLIKDLACLQNCSDRSSCISRLLNDVIAKGVCDLTDEFGYNPGPGIYEPVVSCNMSSVDSEYGDYGFSQTVIGKGTCSEQTEKLLLEEKCRKEIFEKQGFIQNTLVQLVLNSCNYNVSEFYVGFMEQNQGGARRKRSADEEESLHSRVKRLAPAQSIYGSDNIRTRLEYDNTKGRYSWICSLRSKGPTPEHLCAVNLLSLPPKPTVLVGAAHCTYLCKDEGRQVPSCCCSGGPDNCEDTNQECGENPAVGEMEGEDAEIVCGEWHTNITEDETVLNITKIIRHPRFNTAVGPIGGNDIAVFKVNNKNLRKKGIKPACFFPRAKPDISTGIHSGWSKPPPRAFVEKHAKEYLKFYGDFFKQWHYKMDILDICEDPKVSPINGAKLEYPSNSSYPAGTTCATDFSKQSCFSVGDSGSPLMVEDGDKFYIEGLLSFVKGCDVFTFGTTNSEKNNAQLNQQTENPSTYTKLSCFLPWIAKQYGMEYDNDDKEDSACDASSGNPDDTKEVCRITPSNLIELFTGEVECKFPFYYKNRYYDGCILFEEDSFVYPVFRCPTRDITTKINGINSFEFLPLVEGYCPEDSTDPNSPLDPNKTDCSPFARRTPFSQCKNNCPGVQAFGIAGYPY